MANHKLPSFSIFLLKFTSNRAQWVIETLRKNACPAPFSVMEVGHVGTEEGSGNPVVVLRVSPPLCI